MVEVGLGFVDCLSSVFGDLLNGSPMAVFVFTWMWTVSSLFLNSRVVHFGWRGRLRDKASMPSGFPVDSPGPVTVFEVPGRKGIDDIDACATAYQAVKPRISNENTLLCRCGAEWVQ